MAMCFVCRTFLTFHWSQRLRNSQDRRDLHDSVLETSFKIPSKWPPRGCALAISTVSLGIVSRIESAEARRGMVASTKEGRNSVVLGYNLLINDDT